MSVNNNNNRATQKIPQLSINIEKFNPNKFEKELVPFVTIPTTLVQNITDFLAGFIWIYLQSLPPTWVPNKKQIMDHFQISSRTYERKMSYLVENKLISYVRERKENGQLGDCTLIVRNGYEFTKSVDNHHTAKFDGVVKTPHHTAIGGGMVESEETHASIEFSPHRQNSTHINNINNNINKNIYTKKNKQKKVNDDFSKPQMLEDNPHCIDEQGIDDFLKIRKKKQAPMTKTAWRRINNNLTKINTQFDITPSVAFAIMVTKTWLSPEPEYFNNQKHKPKVTNTNHTYDHNDISWANIDLSKEIF